MPMQLIKKPVEVEGVRWTGDNLAELQAFCGEALISGPDGNPIIKTLEGDHAVVLNAVVVKGVKGEFYPVDPDIFPLTYEEPSGTVATEAHWNKAERDEAPAKDWAVPEKQKLRIDDKKHVFLAWSQLHRTKGLSTEEIATAKKRILAAAKRFKIDTSSWDKGTESFEDDVAIGVDLDVKVEPMSITSYLLAQAAEEAGEFAQAAVKAIRFGFNSPDPKNQLTARAKLVKEGNDILAVVQLLNDELLAQNVEALVGLGDPSMVAASAEQRRERLVNEYEAGRFTIPTPVEE